jgi:hypothetical protein
VKIHNPFIHVVLSLLLLISQQLGLLHMMKHMDSSSHLSLANTTDVSTELIADIAVGDNDAVKAGNTSGPIFSDSLADLSSGSLYDSVPDSVPDVSCDQCLAFSQLAQALPVVVSSPSPVIPASFIAGIHDDHSICSQTQCAYLSRAPPVLA